MKVLSSWGLLTRTTAMLRNGAIGGSRMSRLPFMGLCCIMILLILYRTMICQYTHKEREDRLFPFDSMKEIQDTNAKVGNLPRGIVEKNSDMELKPLRFHRATEQKDDIQTHRNALAISAGIKQKHNVDTIVTKFFAENFTVILFHYDGYVDGWHDFTWSSKAIHIAAHNQTKWWFAKRFLHPDVISVYDYVFLWDEDLVVDHFHPGRYVRIMESEGLEISQPALDAGLSEVHHRITIRRKSAKLHKRVYDHRGSKKCTDASEGPPCTGWVEGMAPVFSRSAWRCAWHLIQNDLIHGWGMDMKLGYCAQGDRSKKVGVIDSEYVVHLGIRTLGGPSAEIEKSATHDDPKLRRSKIDMRSEIRRQSTLELEIFQRRWDKAVREDSDWADPFLRSKQKQKVTLRDTEN